MDAVEFLKTKNRMCETYLRTKPSKCDGCPFDEGAGAMCSSWCFKHMAEAVARAEQYPVKTRQSVFLGQYPETALDKHGIIQICPAELFSAYRSDKLGCTNSHMMCYDCRRRFWTQEAE